MIDAYLKKRTIAAAGYLGGIALIVVVKSLAPGAGMDWLVQLIGVASALALVAACFFYLRAKKRSAAWLLLMPLGVIGLLIYAGMDDLSAEPDNIPCPACGGANFPADPHCRLCKTPMGTFDPVV